MISPIDLGYRFKEIYGYEPHFIASAPARLDFLNTHQDYKGLPVVSVGIDLRTYVAIGYGRDGVFRVYSSSLRQMDRFKDAKLVGGKWFGDYIRAVIIALKNHSHDLPPLDIYIDSEIPIASGLGSSAALEVSVLGAINSLLDLGLGLRDIAELAFEAENAIMGIPCGRLDQYGSAFGGVLAINTRPPYNVEELGFRRGVFIAIDSGIRHSTADIHPKRQSEIDLGLRRLLELDLPKNIRARLGERYWMPRWDELEESDLSLFLNKIDPISAKRILFTLRMHRSTVLALKIMRSGGVDVDEVASILGLGPSDRKKLLGQEDLDLKAIGLVMIYQHRLLSELYDVSLPELDRIVKELVMLGAYGAKLSGAGLGGSVMGLTDTRDRSRSMLNKIQGTLAPRGWVVSIDKGLDVGRW